MKGIKKNKMENLIELFCNKYQRDYYKNNKKRKDKIKISKKKNKLE